MRRIAGLLVLLCAGLTPAWGAEVRDGVSGRKISLPSGPGSIEGLGESFEPQLNTGTSTYGLGFRMPPGRSGHAPTLGLAYNAGSPNGCVGIGWSLTGLDHVQRQTDKGLPRYDEQMVEGRLVGSDAFLTAAGEELVQLSDGTFRAENEASFRQYRYDAAADVWTAGTREGHLLTFGAVDEGACPGTTPRIASGGRTFRWMLTRAEDPNGNRIDYCYAQFPDSPNAVYLAQVAYTRHAERSLAGEHRVVLTWEAGRPDPVTDYRPGFELTWGRRLDRVDLCTRGGSFDAESACPGDAGARVGAYELVYEDEAGAPCPSCLAAYRASRLARVTRLGADGADTLPSLRFGYTELDPGDGLAWQEIASFPTPALLGPNAALVDLDADGLPEVLETPADDPGFYRRWPNRGVTAFGTVRFGAEERFPAPRRLLESRGTQIADLDGTGATDLVAEDVVEGDFELYPGNAAGAFEMPARTFAIDGFDGFFGPGGFENASVRLADLDFDKRIDVLRTVASEPGRVTDLLVRFSRRDGDGGGSFAPTVSCAPVEEADFAEGRTSLADLNGDRLLDLAVARPTAAGDALEVRYYPALGRGRFGTGRDERTSCAQAQGSAISLGGDPVALTSGAPDARRIFWEDLTGDGLADVVWVGPTELALWVNRGGGELRRVTSGLPVFPAGIEIALGSADPANDDVVQLADLDGNGTRDVLLVDRQTGRAYLLDLAGPGGVPAHLLASIDNGLGAVTSIAYTSTSALARAAEGSGRPWRTRVPFPTAVVTRTTVRIQGSPGGGGHDPATDGIVTDFRYRDGFYDGLEKEFRGFSEATVVARGNADQPTLVTRHSFHTGAPDGVDNDGDGLVDETDPETGCEEEPLKGRPLEVRRETCLDGDDGECATAGDVFDHRLSRWEIQTLYGAPSGTCSFDPERPCCADVDCVGAGVCQGAGGSGDPGALFGSTFACDPDRRRDVQFARSTAERTAVVERGSGPPVDLLTTRAYDGFGNVTEESDWGKVAAADPPAFGCLLLTGICEESRTACGSDADCPFAPFEPCVKQSAADAETCPVDAGAVLGASFPDPASADLPGDERRLQRTYAENATRWMVDRPATQSVRDGAGAVEATSRTFYDGLGLGQASRGNPTREEEALFAEERFIPRARMAYDAFGNLVEGLDARDNRRTFAYDEAFATYPVQETVHLDGYTISMTADYHEGFGTVVGSTTWAVTGLGPRYAFEYDTFARPVAEIHPGDSSAAPTRAYAYHLNEADDGISFVAARQREVAGGGTIDRFSYVDGLGRELGTKEEGDAPGEWIFKDATAFNRRGQGRDTWLPYFTATPAYERPAAGGDRHTMALDALGRDERTTHPDGIFMESVYRPLVVDTFDENDTAGLTPGAHVTHTNDGLDRLVEVVERNPDTTETLVTRYAYDARDNLLEIVDAQGNRTSMAYDALSRRTFLNEPNRGVLDFAWDDADNLVATLDARGQRILMSYDRANRLASENYLDTTGDPTTDPVDVAYHYDRPAPGGVPLGDGTTGLARFTAGELAFVEDLSGEEHTSYDARRRPVWTAKRVLDPLAQALTSYTRRFSHDSADRVTAMTYPDGDRIAFGYGARGLLDSAAGPNGGREILRGISYRPSAQIERMEYGSGVATEYGYDPRLRLTSLRVRGAGETAGTDLLHYAYDLDPASNVTDIEDLRGHVPPTEARHNTQRLAYDGLHRLVSYRLGEPGDPSASRGGITYAYDKIDNLLAKSSDLPDVRDGKSITDLGALTYGGSGGRTNRDGRAPGDPPGPQAVTSTDNGTHQRAYAYDANGNMTSIDGLAATWDFKDRLVALEGPDFRAQYVYDYADRRVTKKVEWTADRADRRAGQIAVTQYPSQHFEIRDPSQPTRFVFAGDQRLAEITGTLDPGAERIQRLTLVPGWNLVALAVEAPDAAAQLGLGDGDPVAEAYVWDGEGQTYAAATAASNLGRGTVLWLRATRGDVLTVRGAYPGEPEGPRSLEDGFTGVPGLERVPIDDLGPGTAWLWDPLADRWRARLPAPLDAASDAPALLGPGRAFFAHPPPGTEAELAVPPATARIRYHHPDHLGSSNLLTDQAGRLVEETVFYPYGESRSRARADDFDLPTSDYLFTGKEQDGESGLQYFEARYYAGIETAFASVDPLSRSPNARTAPRRSNPYAYALRNPLGYVDPSGQQPEPESAQVQRANENQQFGFTFDVVKDMSHSGLGPAFSLKKVFSGSYQSVAGESELERWEGARDSILAIAGKVPNPAVLITAHVGSLLSGMPSGATFENRESMTQAEYLAGLAVEHTGAGDPYSYGPPCVGCPRPSELLPSIVEKAGRTAPEVRGSRIKIDAYEPPLGQSRGRPFPSARREPSARPQLYWPTRRDLQVPSGIDRGATGGPIGTPDRSPVDAGSTSQGVRLYSGSR